jgi:hypothetical protein
MTVFRLLVIAVSVGLSLLAWPLRAAGPVELKPSAPIARHIAAFPHVVGGARGSAAARINRTLQSAEQGVGCSGKGDWTRSILVTMRGPHYLGLLAHDDWYCGGAYPDTSATAMVFNLDTGAPIDWPTLFSPGVIEAATTDPGSGGSEPIRVSSAALWQLYAEAVAADGVNRDPECRQVLVDQSGTGLMLWPDAAADGLGLQPSDFPHVIKACGPPETLDASQLHKLGASAVLLDAIAEAHRRRWYDKAPKSPQ